MIASLRGKLLEKDTQSAVIECAGVGYGVSMSLASLARLPAVGSEVLVYVHTHLTQDALRLYGFAEVEERATFEALLGADRVGPKLALSILSVHGPVELRELVAREDKGALTRVPGVGNKTAERLLVELKGRLDRVGAVVTRGPAVTLVADTTADFVSALVNLGYQPKDAEKRAKAVLAEHPSERDLAVLVRAALRAG